MLRVGRAPDLAQQLAVGEHTAYIGNQHRQQAVSRLRALTVDSVRRFMEASAVIAEALRDAGRGLAPEPDAGPGGPARTAGP